MILIIDGHGDESSSTFNFKRSAGTQVSLYSYTRAGISAQGVSSISWIKTAVGGNIPQGYVELNKSKVGGTPIKDRLLTSLATSDQPFSQFPANFIDASNANFRLFHSPDGSICYFALALDSGSSIFLSQVLNFYNTESIDAIWVPCRGAGGAAAARYKKLVELALNDAATYQSLLTKTYGA